jgi:hypothetical protein
MRGGGTVHLIDTASPFTQSVPWTRDGGFAFSSISPGRYAVVALSDTGGLLGRAEAFIVPSGDVVLSIALQPGSTVTGRIVFQNRTGQAADPTTVRLSLEPASRADFSFRTSPATSDGRFSWTGVPAGSYRIGVSTMANLQPGWRAVSAMLGGRDILDGAFDVGGAAPGEMVITLSDARSVIAGTLVAADGTPVSDYSLLAFSADAAYRRPASRRTQVVRPTSDGHFAVRDLPAGDYLLVALTDLETGQWHNPEFLAELAPFGIKVSLADGEKKTQNIRMGGGYYSTR